MFNQLYVLIYLSNQWIPCGLLEYEEKGNHSFSLFRYGRQYLERRDAISIDPISLPLIDRTFETEPGFHLFNGVRDTGPDKWGRYLLDKKFSRTLNEIEYIAASSDDRVGALAFTPLLGSGPQQYEPNEAFIEATVKKRLDLKTCISAVNNVIDSEETDTLRDYLEYGPSLGGARPKATVLWKDELYLAKFSLSLDSKNEPLIEYATMLLAKECGLNVPPIFIQKIEGRSVFLIKRFDREKNNRTPFISGLTITGLHESDFGSWSYFALAEAIIHFSKNIESNLTELFKRLIFNIAVYNNDDHLRNFGFLANDQHWDLSPLYDVVPSIIKTQSYALAMTLGVEGKKASFKNALSLCEKFRLTKNQAMEIIEQTIEVTSKWEATFSHLGVSTHDIQLLKNSFLTKD